MPNSVSYLFAITIFLPKYCADLNDIEHDFSALKRARMYSPINKSLYEIISNYCAQ